MENESKTFSIRIKINLLDWLKKQADGERRTLNNYISNVLADLKADKEQI